MSLSNLQYLASLLGPISASSQQVAAESASGVSDGAQKAPRDLVGLAALHLHRKLQEMYWDGVKRELKHIVLTLKKWQLPEYTSTVLPDENDHFIHGYDTFLDQVSQSTWKFAQRRGKNVSARKTWRKARLPTYEEALRDRCRDMFAEERSSTIKEDMRNVIEGQKHLSMLQERARMLFQAAGFLDIDKVIEYRPPEESITFWKRPSIPQLRLLRFDANHMPIFGPEFCSNCKQIIRGCMFRNESTINCEDCYRKLYYGKHGFVKLYKHCILSEVIIPEASRSICRCTAVQRIASDGSSRTFFPMDEADGHRDSNVGALRCGLFDLPDLVAETKYKEMFSKLEKYTNLGELKRTSKELRQERKQMLRVKNGKGTGSQLVDTKKRFAEFDRSTFKEVDDDVPFLFRAVTDKYPFGNVHMALRLGPLVIENGVKHTFGGALITSRDPPNLQVLLDTLPDSEESLILGDEGDRMLWSQKRKREPKRYKCMMKQVVGGAFAGVFNSEIEEDIINTLIAESKATPDPGLGFAVREKLLDSSIERLLSKVKDYIGSRITKYLKSIADRLIDPNIELRWDFRTNNCQNFCDNLIDMDLFGPLSSSSPEKGIDQAENELSLYLMSFVCRPGSYTKESVLSKYDVPNGLTEEYLLKFHFGRHEESDIIDVLQEYWYDWGAFGGTIYPYQDLFPWDCTEAFNRYPTKCGGCNISKHVLAFPFDSFSIIALHLSKSRYLYPPSPPEPAAANSANTTPSSCIMTDISWFRNRLTLLIAQSRLLSAAAAMHHSTTFRTATTWLHSQNNTKLDRLKLGGIHRAQPFSHHFEKGAYHHYFIADWANLRREQQIAAYEVLRDGRMRQADVDEGESSDNDGGGCGSEFFIMRKWRLVVVGRVRVGIVIPGMIVIVEVIVEAMVMGVGEGISRRSRDVENGLQNYQSSKKSSTRMNRLDFSDACDLFTKSEKQECYVQEDVRRRGGG